MRPEPPYTPDEDGWFQVVSPSGLPPRCVVVRVKRASVAPPMVAFVREDGKGWCFLGFKDIPLRHSWERDLDAVEYWQFLAEPVMTLSQVAQSETRERTRRSSEN